MKILVSGANGFIARNLIVRLKELKKHEIFEVSRSTSSNELKEFLLKADFIFHLAGVNRPQNEEEFKKGNTDFAGAIIRDLKSMNRNIPVVYSSSTQAAQHNSYGVSKKNAEDLLLQSGRENIYIYRLPNVFGKWSRPNYNSVVATFCYNIANDLPITVNDPNVMLNLVYVDDVVDSFIYLLEKFEQGSPAEFGFQKIQPVYQISLGALAEQIRQIKEGRKTLITENVGQGLTRALHATFLSFFKPSQFTYEVPKYEDPRGSFVEMLKTKEGGQISYFSAHPGVTRGGHYHHTKTEKFLVIKGIALYKFRHIVTDEFFEILVDAADGPRVVETVPGWSHDITNVGNDELIVMLWANEIFDRQRPDTVAHKV